MRVEELRDALTEIVENGGGEMVAEVVGWTHSFWPARHVYVNAEKDRVEVTY